MNKGNTEIASVPRIKSGVPRKDGVGGICLNWQDSPAIQALLDVVVEIMANEYVEVARENKDVFTDNEHSNSRSCG